MNKPDRLRIARERREKELKDQVARKKRREWLAGGGIFVLLMAALWAMFGPEPEPSESLTWNVPMPAWERVPLEEGEHIKLRFEGASDVVDDASWTTLSNSALLIIGLNGTPVANLSDEEVERILADGVTTIDLRGYSMGAGGDRVRVEAGRVAFPRPSFEGVPDPDAVREQLREHDMFSNSRRFLASAEVMGELNVSRE